MLTDNEKYKEEGFVGDDTFQSREKEVAHLCRIIQNTVERKVFTFQQALDAYEVTRAEYDYYQAKNFITEVQGVADTLPENENVLAFLNTATNFLSIRFDNYHYKGLDQDFSKAISVLKRLSRKVAEKSALHDAD
jgi:hypothetical protein